MNNTIKIVPKGTLICPVCGEHAPHLRQSFTSPQLLCDRCLEDNCIAFDESLEFLVEDLYNAVQSANIVVKEDD